MGNFDLNKEAEKVKFMLAKKEMKKVTATVCLDLDISGSMQGLYGNGTVQRLVERIIPVALNFDDNGELDIFTFSSGKAMVAEIETATSQNYDGFVEKEILNNSRVPKWNCTDYAPALEANLEKYGFYVVGGQEQPTTKESPKVGFMGRMFGGNKAVEVELSVKMRTESNSCLQANSKSGYPAIIFFITDGENDDKSATDALLRQCQEANANVYFLFIGIGDESFRFLDEIGDRYSNTGFLKIDDIETAVSDDAIYEALLPDELTDWLKAKEVK